MSSIPFSMPVAHRAVLAEILPIIGMPMVIHHQTGFCLASVYQHGPGQFVIETRLSGDFTSRQAAEQHFSILVHAAIAKEPVWSLIEASCAGARLMASSLPGL